MEMKILAEGRKVLKNNVDQTAERTVLITEYDDGTILKCTQVAENINVECNKVLEVQPDGKTIKIIG